MNSLMSVKYKAHKFINFIFYLLFFLMGYFVGGGSLEKVLQNINFI